MAGERPTSARQDPSPARHGGGDTVTGRKRIHWLWIAGVGILSLDLLLLAAMHSIPAGYGSWVCVGRILGGLLFYGPGYPGSYMLAAVPVPNSALVMCVALLGPLITFEGAAKLATGLVVLSLPLGVLAANRTLHGGDGRTAALVALPLAMGWQSFLSQNCSIGLSLIMWGIAYFGWRTGRMRTASWIVLSGLVVLVFFAHGLSFLLAIVLVVSFVWYERIGLRGKILAMGVVLSPSLLLATWYLAGPHPPLLIAGTWSVVTVLQSVLKPLMLFMRVHGVTSPVPPTYGNLPWFLLCGTFLFWTAKLGIKKRSIDRRFVAPIVFCLVCVLVLPDPFLGLDQPGTRFGLPLVLCIALLAGRIQVRTVWGIAMIAVAIAVLLYDAVFFVRFDRMASELTADLGAATEGRRASYVLTFDWPQTTSVSEGFSAYAGGLSGIPQLYNARNNLVCEIPETGPVVMTDSLRARFPKPAGSNLAAWKSSLLASYPLLARFPDIVVLGATNEAAGAVEFLLERDWSIVRRNEIWTIMRSPGRTGAGQ